MIEKVTGADQWQRIREERAQDLLIYLALSRFDGRPNFSQLPRELQLDVKSFFASYAQACATADELLFSIGDMSVIDGACLTSLFGKLTPKALYIHEVALDQLSPVLRLFEGCARGYIGRVEGANLIKLHRTEPKVSYLSYPEFDADPHPALTLSFTVNLQSFRVTQRDFRAYRNPPILHRKETFLLPEDPRFAKYARLTRIEEKHGLYDNVRRIGTRDGWTEIINQKGFCFRGHRLVAGSKSRKAATITAKDDK